MARQTTITVVGGNLWAIAAAVFGDAAQGSRIALANGLSDPMLPGDVPTTLRIPAPISTAGDGLFPQ